MKIPDAVQKVLLSLRVKAARSVTEEYVLRAIERVIEAVYANPPRETDGEGLQRKMEEVDARVVERFRRELFAGCSLSNCYCGKCGTPPLLTLIADHWYMCGDGEVRQAKAIGCNGQKDFVGVGKFLFSTATGTHVQCETTRPAPFTILREIQSTNPQPGETWMTERGGVVVLKILPDGRPYLPHDGISGAMWLPDCSPCPSPYQLVSDDLYKATASRFGRLLYRVSEWKAKIPSGYEEVSLATSFHDCHIQWDDKYLVLHKDGTTGKIPSGRFSSVMEAMGNPRVIRKIASAPPDPIEAVLKALASGRALESTAPNHLSLHLRLEQVQGLLVILETMKVVRDQGYLFSRPDLAVPLRFFREAVK